MLPKRKIMSCFLLILIFLSPPMSLVNYFYLCRRIFLPPQYSLYLYISSISLPQSVGRFVKIVLKISLFYIYRRHSNRKPERSWNIQNIMVKSNSRPHIQIMSLTLEASQMQRSNLCETSWNFNEKENSVSLKKFHKDAMQPGSQKLHLMVMTPL